VPRNCQSKVQSESNFMPARALPSLITFQFHSHVVSLLDSFRVVYARYLALKGLTKE